jgi:formyltetrahydrofolate hydrolase
MLTEKDIYSHLAHGGSIDDLYTALSKEIDIAKEKIKAEEIARKEAEERKVKIAELRGNAVAALTEYFALVNTDIDKDVINEVLNILASAKVSANPFYSITTLGI